jgi:hypothetical protein
MAPWWWFLREPKHVRATVGILIVLIFLWFYNCVHNCGTIKSALNYSYLLLWTTVVSRHMYIYILLYCHTTGWSPLKKTFPSDGTMALGLTQPLVKMSNRNIPGDKDGRCVRVTTSPLLMPNAMKICEPKPPGTLWATPGLLRDTSTRVSVSVRCLVLVRMYGNNPRKMFC